MYTIVFEPAGYRIFKKLDPKIREQIHNHYQALKTNPLAGEPLRGKRQLRSLHFTYEGVAYRIIYHMLSSQRLIVIQLADKRENIYKRLQEMKL
jgi:mRNA-degrading endonuclease RelE of RelBE toxin-antitoxin system